MSATSINGMWFEPTPRRLLDSNVPVSRLMTTSAEARALDVRWPRIPSVSAYATVREAAHLMAACGLRQVQVRSPDGEVVGVLSASDLFRWVAGDPRDADEPEAGRA
jgi:CBS domain-containing protein